MERAEVKVEVWEEEEAWDVVEVWVEAVVEQVQVEIVFAQIVGKEYHIRPVYHVFK